MSPLSARRGARLAGRGPAALWRRIVVVLTVAGLGVSLAACSPTVPLHAAADANNPACADVIVHLPTSIAAPADGSTPGYAKRSTNAQATAAWGDPTIAILTCGVEVPGPSTLRCISINDVDWLESPGDDQKYTYTTYGRDPAVEVYVDLASVSGDTVLVDLSQAINYIPATGGCTDPEVAPLTSGDS